MPTQPVNFPTTLLLTDADAHLAEESSRRLAKYFTRKRTSPVRVRLEKTGHQDPGEPIDIPASAFRLLNDILLQMAQGNSVVLVPMQAELTTQQAAEILGVSRPFLVRQLDQGSIPHRKVGTHRRVLLADLLQYKQKMNEMRTQALEELSKLDQEMNLGY